MTTQLTDSQVRAFASYFPGNENFFGQTVGPFVTDELTGKVKGTSTTIQGAVTLEHYRRHLEDEDYFLGICFRRADDTCLVGGIDVDRKDHTPEQLDALLAHLAGLDWILQAERTKSGGIHLWWLLPQPLPADEVRQALEGALLHLCLPKKTEIFPGRKSEGTGGLWLNLPKNLIRLDGTPMSLEESVRAMALCQQHYVPPVAPDDTQKPSVDDLLEKAVGKIEVLGGRNKAGFYLACRLRDALYTRDEARPLISRWVEAANAAAPGEPYTAKEAQASFKQAYKHPPRPRQEPTPWDDPEPLPAVPRAMDLDAELTLVPEVIREYVRDISVRMGVAPEAVFAAMLTVLAGCLNGAITVRPKHNDTSFRIFVNLYGAIVAPPGMLKSPILGELTVLLRREAKILHDEFKKEKFRWLADLEKFKAGEKKGDPSLVLGEEPLEQLIFVSNITPEKLKEDLENNPRGILFLRDELSGLFTDMGLKGREGLERELLLSGWSGGCDFERRKTREDTFIEHAILSVFGTIQPAVLQRRVVDFSDDGLINRFQALVCIEPKFFPVVDRAPNNYAVRQFEILVKRFLNLPNNACTLGFTPPAQELYLKWSNLNRQRILDEPSGVMRACLEKYSSFVPKLAALFELCVWANGTHGNGQITLAALEQAIHVAAFFESHSRRVFSVAGQAMPEARALADYLRAGTITSPFSAREERRRSLKGLRDVTAMQKAITSLASRHWIRKLARDPKARGELWEVNPEVLATDFKPYEDCHTGAPDLAWLGSWKPSEASVNSARQLPLWTWDQIFNPDDGGFIRQREAA